MRRFIRTSVALCFFMAFGATSVGSAEDVLKVVPDNLYFVAYSADIGRANENLAKVSQAVGAPIPNLLNILKLSPEFAAILDLKGMAAVVALPREGSIPGFAGLLPIKDYGKFVEQLRAEDAGDGISKASVDGRPIVVAHKGDYAVVGDAADQDIVAAVLQSKKAFAQQVEPLGEVLKGGDVNIIVSRGGVEYAMQTATKSIQEVKKLLAERGEETKQVVAAFGMYESLFRVIGENVTHFAMSIRVDDQGALHVATRTLLKPSSVFAELAKTPNAAAADSLKDLPPGPFVFAFSGSMVGQSSESLVRWSMGVWKQMFGADDITDDQVDQIVKASIQAMRGVRSMSMSMGAGDDDEPLYSNMYLLFETDNAQAYLDRYVELIDTFKGLGDGKPLPLYGDMKVESIDVDGNRTLKVTMNMKSLVVGQQPQMADMYKKMFGGDNMVIYLAGADEKTVVGAYTSEDSLKRALKAARDGQPDLSADPLVGQTTAMLPAEAHMRAYLSLSGTLQFVKRSIAMFAPVAVPEFPEIPPSPPIGFSARMLPNGLDTDMIIPAETIKSIGTFVQRVKDMQANQN